MKKILGKLLMSAMVLGMLSGVAGTTAEAQETQTGVVIGGSEKILLETGKSYDVPVSFVKADDFTTASMATEALTGASLTANEDGSVTAVFEMTDITIYSFFGYAKTLSLNNTHTEGVSATNMTVTSTYSKKVSGWLSSTTYTIPATFEGNLPYLDQNGVYVQMELLTTSMTMNQEGYFIFDFAAISADYSAVDAAMAKVPSDLSIYTVESADALTAAVNQVEAYYHKDRQAEVAAMAEALEAALEGLEEDHTIRMEAEVRGTVLVTPSTFTVSIPETISLGTLSKTEDTVIAYHLGVDMAKGNDGKTLVVTIQGDSEEALKQGANEIAFANSLTNHIFTDSDEIEETILVEASAVNNAYHGDYQGTMTFQIYSEYVNN